MKLHISPKEMGEMYFYDIMLLYKRYEAYVKEENESAEKTNTEYNEQDQQQQPPDYNSVTKNVADMANKIGSLSMDSIGKGYVGF